MIFRSPYPEVAIPEVPFSEFVFQHVAQWQDQPAFIDGLSGRALTFGQVADGARLVASSLAKRGLQKGDVFAICCPNVPEYAVAFHAVARLGGIITPMNPLYTPDELAFQLHDTGAKYVLTVPPFLENVATAAQRSPVQDIFVLGEAAGATPFATLMQHSGPLPAIPVNVHTDVVVLPYSSGTSGRPKGVMLTHYNMVSVLRQIQPGLRMGPGDRTVGMLPFFHIFGMNVLLHNTLYRGYTCVTMPRFDLVQFLELVQQHSITHLFIVPPIAVGLAKAPVVANYALSSLRYILSGAAPLDGAVQQALAERLRVPVVQGYGMTETSLAIAMVPEEQPKTGTAGKLIANMAAKVLDTASGTEVGPGELGEICVRGPNLMQGYLNHPEATQSTIDAAGWLHTGDVGYVDHEGYLFVVDRVKELIKYKGMQVAPAELEGLLLTHPAIADTAVIPSPDAEAGEIPKAFVVLKGPCTPDEIMAFVAERVAPHKRVRQVAIVEAIPKSPTGKILRRVFVEQERVQPSVSP
jgi:acyl-CoA synthetase (AMP-forming)/AMP-acid ligase II